jgi:hypothetical protein
MIEKPETKILDEIKTIEKRIYQLFNIKNPTKQDKGEEQILSLKLRELTNKYYGYYNNICN